MQADEQKISQLIDERDYAHDLLDKFVDVLGGSAMFGEHSSSNSPWCRALAYLEIQITTIHTEGCNCWRFKAVKEIQAKNDSDAAIYAVRKFAMNHNPNAKGHWSE